MKEVFTEEEVIKITIEHGYDGSEFNTAKWKQRGCLQMDRTQKMLMDKLETIYASVEVEGKGKKRRYILTDKKDEVAEREFNYKGRIASQEDEVMKEYIFNQLIKKDGLSYSYSVWAKELGFFDTDTLSIPEMIEKIKELHYGNNVIYNPKEIVSQFIKTLGNRNKDVIEKSFQRLQKENRIKVSATYYFKMLNGETEEVTKEDYDIVQEGLKEFIESKGVSYYIYSQAVNSFHKSEKMKSIIKEAKNYLEEWHGIQYSFKSFKITVLNKEVKQEVSKDEFETAYVQRLTKLTKDRQEKDSYKKSISYWQRFYYLNTLTLLIHMGTEEVNELFKEEVKSKIDKQEAYALDYMIYQFEKDIEKENIRHTFGNV
ncbi:hypothetical protein P4T04_03165 [Bacillus badius]|uniref:hypothetical protein n=1 Tax=Bacillus badius TaxID=1455 RepID=UPI002E1DAC12|nr:hypothetical protein [Bacillus badius]